MSIESILDTIAPQFTANTSRADYIELAKLQTSAGQFGVKYDLAVALRTAHDMTMYIPAGTSGGFAYGGMITSEREGDLSRNFGGNVAQVSNVALSGSVYGQQLDALIKSTIIKVVVIT